MKDRPKLRPGDEEQQQEAELVHRAEDDRRGAVGREEPRLGRRPDEAQHGGPQEQAADDLADRPGLAVVDEHRAHAVGAQKQRGERDEHVGQIGRRQRAHDTARVSDTTSSSPE